jgi:hypothetical protein
MRCAFVCVESLRQGYNELIVHLPGWIALRLVYEDSAEDFFPLWTLIGVQPEIADLLCELQLIFQNGTLKVAQRWRDHAELPQML